MTRYHLLEVVSGLGMGGAEKALLARMNYLPDGFDQTVLNVRPELDVLTVGMEISHHKITRKGVFRFIGIVRFLHENSFDAIIVRTPLDAVRFGVIRLVFKEKCPKIVFEAHSNYVSKKFWTKYALTFLLKIASKQFALVIAVSESVKNGPLCKNCDTVHVVYLGSQIKAPSPNSPSHNLPSLLFVGRLVDLKRPIWLLERIASLNSKIYLPHPTLTIVGTGPLEVEVKEFIRVHQLETIVNFVGIQIDVSSFYAAATHLVSCSTNEGLPLTFFEAKLSGLSILATPSGGGSEIFSSEDLELSTFDSGEFEEALTRILTSSPRPLAIREKIRLRSQWMSVEKSAQRYYALISIMFST